MIICNPILYYLQTKPGVISAVGGLTLGKPGLQIQVLNSGLSQMPTLQPAAPVQTQARNHTLLPVIYLTTLLWHVDAFVNNVLHVFMTFHRLQL